MSPELQKYYEERFSMMATQGWIDLMEDVANMIRSTNSLRGITPDKLLFRQGELNIMDWLMNLKAVSERAYEDLQNAGD